MQKSIRTQLTGGIANEKGGGMKKSFINKVKERFPENKELINALDSGDAVFEEYFIKLHKEDGKGLSRDTQDLMVIFLEEYSPLMTIPI